MRIFLVGFMGSGKTYWGQLWARVNNFGFLDLDEKIQESEKNSITDIFEKKGETYFRDIESVELHKTTAYNNCFIACGGGTACFADNMQWMNENGLTVYLYGTPLELFANIKEASVARPLLKNLNEAEILFFIQRLLTERKAFYEEARVQFSLSELTENSLAEVLNRYH